MGGTGPGYFSGLRGKLIAIFVLIKVIPLLLLAWYAWYAARDLGNQVTVEATGMADAMLATTRTHRVTRTHRPRLPCSSASIPAFAYRHHLRAPWPSSG